MLAVLIILVGSRSFAVMSQLVVLTTISLWMLAIGIFAYRNGDTLAKFFLLRYSVELGARRYQVSLRGD